MNDISYNLNQIAFYLDRHFVRQEKSAILMASALPGEGVTTLTLSVALKCQEAHGLRTLAVEMNPYSPSFAKLLGLKSSASFEKLLEPDSQIEHFIHPLKEGCDILPLPIPVPPQIRGIPSPGLLHRITKQVEGKFDLLLFDVPPVIRYTETLSLVDSVPDIMLIVEAGRTRSEIVEKAQMYIQRAGLNLAGTILNKHKRYIPSVLYRTFFR